MALDESESAPALNELDVAHPPTVPARSTARTRKRTETPAATVRRDALVVAEASVADRHEPPATLTCISYRRSPSSDEASPQSTTTGTPDDGTADEALSLTTGRETLGGLT